MPPYISHRHALLGMDTTKTQKEFLDSLRPIPIESVDENSRRCPYCWRSYGETTPGQDDAEKPVKLACNHVFGEQCMRSLFAIKDPVHIAIVPFSFAPGTKGADLAARLCAYVGHTTDIAFWADCQKVDAIGVEKSALLSGGSREADFKRLLGEALGTGPYPKRTARGDTLLGDWNCLFVEALMSGIGSWNLGRVHLFENAIIFDKARVSDPIMEHAEEYITAAYGLPMTSLSLPGSIPAAVLHDLPGSGLSTPAGSSDDESSKSMTSPQSSFSPSSYGFPPITFQSYYPSPVDSPPSMAPHSSTTSSKPTVPSTSITSESSMTPPVSLAPESSKLAQGPPGHIPFNYASLADQVATALGPKTPKLPIPKTLKVPKPPHETWENEETKIKEKSQSSGSQAGAWKDMIPPVSKIDKLKALKKKAIEEAKETTTKAKSQTTVEVPNPPKANMKKSKVAVDEQTKVRAARQKAQQLEKFQNFVARLAHAFTEVYDAYEQYRFNEAVATGQQPPVRKYKIAARHPPGESPPKEEPDLALHCRSQTIHLAEIGRNEEGDKGCQVSQPWLNYDSGSGDSDDDDDHSVEAAFKGKTIFLQRMSRVETEAVEVPEYVWWRDTRRATDSCPKCRQILFSRRSFDPMSGSGPST